MIRCFGRSYAGIDKIISKGQLFDTYHKSGIFYIVCEEADFGVGRFSTAIMLMEIWKIPDFCSNEIIKIGRKL